MAGNGIGIGIGLRQGTLLNLKPPTAFTSSFVVDTILGQLNWTNNAGATAQYEVYSSTNGGADVLLATTAAGATSYQDTTCKQNASVVYKIRVKKGTKFGDLVSASALATPLCWKTNQSTLGTVTINTLNISAGKSVTVNWGDGTSQAYSGNNSDIAKNYALTGQYNVWLSGDVDDILKIGHVSQSKSYGNVTNWNLPLNAADIYFYLTKITGNWPIVRAKNTTINNFNTTTLGPNTPLIEDSELGLSYSFPNTGINVVTVSSFRKKMTSLDLSNNSLSTSEVNKFLKNAADWYEINAPEANCTFNLSGASMGIPTGGASNADITRLVGYYTAAGRTATVIVRTS